MNERIDWCCRLLPHMRGGIETPEEAVEAMHALASGCGITRFCMTPRYHAEEESVALFLLRRDRAKRELERILPREYKVSYGADVLFSPILHEIEGLERLCLTGTDRLPLSLPLTDYDETIDQEINRLLFERKFKLLFLSFERYVALYPPRAIQRLIRNSDVAVQFNYRALTDPDCCNVIRSLLRQNRPILLGTGVDSLERAWQYDRTLTTHSPSHGIDAEELETLLRINGRFRRR